MNEDPIDPKAADYFKTILKAQETGDYAAFASVMSSTMKKAVPEQSFHGACERMASFLRVPYQAEYMGAMRAGEHVIYFWKISAEGKMDDLLARMGIKEGLVSGILFSPPFDTAKRAKEA